MFQALALVALTLSGLVLLPQQAQAYEVSTANWTASGNTASRTYPSGLVVSVASSGAPSTLVGNTTLGSRGFDAGWFGPTNMATGDPSANFLVGAAGCTGLANAANPCTNRGTLTYTFSQPVRNPTLHFSGLGGNVSVSSPAGTIASQQSDLHAVLTLATAGATLSNRDGNSSLAVTGGTTITAVNDSTSPNCASLGLGGTSRNAAAPAICGSVQVTGTVTTLVFNLSLVAVANALAPSGAASWTDGTEPGDGFGTTVTVPQDFGDAPSSYNTGQAPAHVISNLTLGSLIDEDNVNTRNATTSPFPSVAANGDDTTDTADEDALSTVPDAVVGANGPGTYSLTIPVRGVSKAARLCGYIDLNRDGAFGATTPEQQCANVAAGATSATLTWTTTVGTAGASYLRLRLGYTASQVQTATGLADSGEVEDYPITLVQATAAITIDKQAGTPTGTTAGSTITYTFIVTNSGNVTLNTVAVTDPKGRPRDLPADHAGRRRLDDLHEELHVDPGRRDHRHGGQHRHGHRHPA